jgi:hypothetical protein
MVVQPGQPQVTVSQYMVGVVIVGLIGFILLLATDFAWAWNRSYYTEASYWINPWNTIPGALILQPVAWGLFYCILIAGRCLQVIDEKTLPRLRTGLIISTAAFIVVLLSAVGLLAFAASEDLDEYGLDAGFYGGFIGSLIMIVLFYLALKQLGAPSPYSAPPVAPHPTPQVMAGPIRPGQTAPQPPQGRAPFPPPETQQAPQQPGQQRPPGT